MKKIAIIPARGGSKRIPRKNIKPFLGKPIIAYSIQAALESRLFDEVMVSTDDDEIAFIAKNLGAKIPFLRSTENADDFATTVDVVLEVLDQYEKQDTFFDFGCCIYPTAPFLSPDILQKAFEKMESEQLDSIFPVLPFSFPIQRAVKINANNRIEMFQPEYLNRRSQDLEKAYHDSGQFYWFSISMIQQEKKLWGNNTGVLVLSEMEAHDIDTLEDWKVAEFKYKLKIES
jgi:pseudaminic acid cytidylyltransferase